MSDGVATLYASAGAYVSIHCISTMCASGEIERKVRTEKRQFNTSANSAKVRLCLILSDASSDLIIVPVHKHNRPAVNLMLEE